MKDKKLKINIREAFAICVRTISNIDVKVNVLVYSKELVYDYIGMELMRFIACS
jgi:hypothetical protein